MAFGIAPFVGLDSLVRRRTAQMRDSGLYSDPEPPLDPWTGTPPNTQPVTPDLGPGMPVLGETEGLTQAPARPGFLGRLGQRLISREGLAGIARGIASASQARTGGEAFALGLSGGLSGRLAARQSAEEAAAKKAEADRQYALEAERNQIGWANANRDRSASEGTAEKLQARVDFLRSIGATDEQIMADILQGDRTEREPYTQQPWWMAPGVDPELRAKYEADALRGPQPQQGSEDVGAIASVYGVSEPVARVMKVSGATRIRPRRTTTTAPNPVTGKMETRETIVQEPIQILTLNQAAQKIMEDTDVQRVRDIADGSFTPEDWADDPDLHERLRVIATQRFNELAAPARAAFGEQGQNIFNVP